MLDACDGEDEVQSRRFLCQLLFPASFLKGEAFYEFITQACIICNCEAQGKGRAKGRPRKVTQRSFINGGWWISFP